ncbi:hypothetical protein LOTGIDRAFT_156802 [Lottia gigantea]|uniref:G-protein coupled receptors family 1 profile domain-containing protein n=1 Tax=Lottia gigantea TaxID=225164 RepID=V4BAA0_LOTGI|nr:hypothetical protein LOTGIDRAFT_156802 [Lottia gigantea]ESP02852.1 hypothetical protein LOTGIDRAFT_156802 [Lottia gigantea]
MAPKYDAGRVNVTRRSLTDVWHFLHTYITHSVLYVTMNVTEVNNLTVLFDDINQEFRLQQLPVVIYLILILLVGIPGNSAVCYIFKSQLTERNTKFFLVYLACLDLISCCVCVPFELTDVLLAYTFDSVAACKFFRFLTTWLQGLSGLTLICVAYVRYRKIFKPFKDLERRIRPLCIASAIAALVMAAPALVIFGSRTVKTHIPDVTGKECSTNDNLLHSPVRIVYYTFLLFTFLFSLICFLVFYILIGVYLNRRSKVPLGDGMRKYCGNLRLITSSQDRKGNGIGNQPISPIASNCMCMSMRSRTSQNKETQHLGQLKVKTGRMTVIFLAVTVSFVLSFLPFLIVNILRASEIYFVSSENVHETLIYNLCVRSSYVNSAINPVIYSLLNRGFRKDLAVKIFRMNLK